MINVNFRTPNLAPTQKPLAAKGADKVRFGAVLIPEDDYNKNTDAVALVEFGMRCTITNGYDYKLSGDPALPSGIAERIHRYKVAKAPTGPGGSTSEETEKLIVKNLTEDFPPDKRIPGAVYVEDRALIKKRYY